MNRAPRSGDHNHQSFLFDPLFFQKRNMNRAPLSGDHNHQSFLFDPLFFQKRVK